jgi:hypothetical protein
MQAFNFQDTYLKTMFGFIGITDVEVTCRNKGWRCRCLPYIQAHSRPARRVDGSSSV